MKPLTKVLGGLLAVAVVVIAGVVIVGPDPPRCPESFEGEPCPPTPTPTPDPERPIVITIGSSITKWQWLEAAVADFNARSLSDTGLQVNRRPIEVQVLKEEDALTGNERHWNSWSLVKETLKENIKPTIVSPASTVQVLWLNKQWRGLFGKEVVTEPATSLLSTPVVVAMWESRARALGCWPVPETNCTWKRLQELAASPDGWGMVGHPEWGRFHFGYAYVGESDVGTGTAVLVCMMGLQKTEDLTVGDVQPTNDCGKAIADVERAIVHRGTSSPLILAAMAAGGSAFLDAVTTYEKNVIGFNKDAQTSELLVSVYPQDGTFIAEHPFAILDNAPWVDADQVKAAQLFRDFLFSDEQQQALVPSGLRPSESSIALSSPIDTVHGANRDANLVILDVPDSLVIDQVVAVWEDLKKPANIVLVFDKSSSMQGEKIAQALDGSVGFVDEMGRKDWLSWLPFDNQLYPGTNGLVSEIGEQLEAEIRFTTARGRTALYDAVADAYRELEDLRKDQGDTARYGIVVLSDGKDTSSEATLPMLKELLTPSEGDQAGIQVHTIGIGKDAEDQILTQIAGSTHGGRYWKVDSKTVVAVYRVISKYF